MVVNASPQTAIRHGETMRQGKRHEDIDEQQGNIPRQEVVTANLKQAEHYAQRARKPKEQRNDDCREYAACPSFDNHVNKP